MRRRIRYDSGAVLLLGIILFSLTWNEAAALTVAAIAHEAGHVVMLVMLGSVPQGVHFTLSGPVILYREPDSVWKAVMITLSGPLSGLLLSLILHLIWPACSEISLLLSVFNLIPVLPLDGGRVLQAAMPSQKIKLLSILGFLIPSALMIFGLAMIRYGQNGFGILVFGCWLLLLSCQEAQLDVK